MQYLYHQIYQITLIIVVIDTSLAYIQWQMTANSVKILIKQIVIFIVIVIVIIQDIYIKCY